MTIEDELRRMFAGQRQDDVPGAPTVAGVVRAARRRRTQRTVLSTAGAAGVVAALAVGAVAVLGPPPITSNVPPVATPTAGAVQVLDAGREFDGVWMGLTLHELGGMPGVEVTEFTAAEGRSESCYGHWESASGSGYVSLRGAWGEIPTDEAELATLYQVTSIEPDDQVRTEGGIEPGDTLTDLRAAYGEQLLPLDGNGYYVAQSSPDGQPVTLAFLVESAATDDGDDVVTQIWLDGNQQCSQHIEPAPDVTPPSDPSLPLLDPAAAFGDVQIGMSIDELEALPGVDITEFTAEEGRDDYCFGEWATETGSGYISLRGSWGSIPEAPDDLRAAYEVTTIVPNVAVNTVEGITVGSTVADLRAAYGERLDPGDGDPWDYQAEDNAAEAWMAFTLFDVEPAGSDGDPADDVVVSIAVNGMENCTND